MSKIDDTWRILSQKILASVLVDDGAVFPVNDIISHHSGWFSPMERPIWDGVLACLGDNTPPTIESVTLQVNGATPNGHIKAIAAMFNDEDNKHLIYNAEQLKKIGVLVDVKKFGQELAGLDAVGDIAKLSDSITTRLGGILSDANGRDSDSQSVGDIAWESVEKAQEPGIPTGFRWFDDLTGGLWRGMNYWIVADYKMGKSTLMRNAILNAASLNNPVGVFCAEGARELFSLDCQAMLATEILMDSGLRGDALRLSGLFIKRYYWTQSVFTKQELDAIHEAREIWNGLPIHIWDTRDGIRNLTTMRYLVKRGRVHHGISSFWADYSQLFGSEGNIYERQSTTAQAVGDIALYENIAFCMLAQRNEEGVKSGTGGHSPKVKGGGDAAAAADFLLIPKIDQEIPGLLELQLKLSRHTRAGSGSHWMVPSSGLLMDKYKK